MMKPHSSTETADNEQATPQQKQGMLHAIITQCFGILGILAYTNGFILVYLTGLQINSTRIVAYLSLPALSNSLLVLPCAYLADKYGKKKIGFLGGLLMAIGFIFLMLAGTLPDTRREWGAVFGTIIFSIGMTLFNSSWLAILSPVVPKNLRGSFFGKLRVSWQLCGIIFAGICALYLSKDSPITTYQIFLGIITAALFIRLFFYSRIPEVEKHTRLQGSFRAACMDILRADGFMPFCSYIFLLTLCTAGTPIIFGMIEKKVLNMGDQVVVLMGTLTMIGSIFGFFFGGKLVDRFGTKPAFMVCHFGYGVVILSFLARDIIPGLLAYHVGIIHFFFGVVVAASSIAISTEILALIPTENKSISTSLFQVLLRGGVALSGILAAWILKTGLLNENWAMGDLSLSAYDSILIVYGIMVILLVITLGLVPSVLKKSEWVPHQ